MTTPTFPQPEGLRRIRSDGDMVPRPERAYMPSHLRTTTTLSDSQDASQLHYLPLFQSPGGHSSPTLGPPPAVPTPTNPPLHHQGAAPLADPPAHTQHTTSASVRILAYFGIGRRASHARKAFVSMVWHMAWGCFQVCVQCIFVDRQIGDVNLVRYHNDHAYPHWDSVQKHARPWYQ